MTFFHRARLAGGFALLLYALAPVALAAVPAAPDEAAYRRSLQLREQWMYLTQGLAGPVAWVDAERYRYRRTVEGGFAFVVRRVGDAQAQPVFDQARLALADQCRTRLQAFFQSALDAVQRTGVEESADASGNQQHGKHVADEQLEANGQVRVHFFWRMATRVSE